MASSTAIGSASVILSANADGLTEGFEKAEQKTKGFASRIGGKLMNSGIGRALFGTPEYDAVSGEYLGKIGGLVNKSKGLLKASAFAGVAGAIGGAVAGGILKGFEVLAGVPELIRGLAEKATGPEAGPLRGIVAAMDRVGETATRIGGRLFAAIGPGIVAIADVADGLAERFGGLIDKIGTGLGAALTFGVEVGGELLTVIGEAAEATFKWAAELFGFEDTAASAGKVVMSTFRMLAKGAAYVWDTLKAGAGVIAWVAGKLTSGFTLVLDLLAAMVRAAGDIPGAPQWVGDFGNSLGRASERVHEIGLGMARWGADAIAGFGQSAARVDQWMDGVEQRFVSRRRQLEQTAAKPIESKLGGALMANSAEAYSVVTKFQTQNMVSAADPIREQIRKQEETNRLMRELIRTVTGIELVRTI